MIFLDSEGDLIARARLAPEVVCVQTAVDNAAPRVDLWQDFDPYAALRETVVGANLAYDMACFAAMDLDLLPLIFDAYDAGRIVDVQLDAKLLDIAAGEYGFRHTWDLQELARRVGVRIDKDTDDETGDGSWRLRFGQLKGIPVADWPDGAVRYALAEIPATRAVYLDQQRRRAEWQAQGLDPLGYHSGHAALSAFALHLQSCVGIHTDPKAVEYIAARLDVYMRDTAKRLVRAGLVRPDGSRNTKAAARAMVRACAKSGAELRYTEGAAAKEQKARDKLRTLENAYAVATDRRRKTIEKQAAAVQADWLPYRDGHVYTGGLQLDRDAAILSGSRVLELYADYAGANLLYGRVDRLRQGYQYPLQTRFDPLKETARTSSTQPQEPLVGEQMQNFPRASGATPAEKKRERAGEFFTGLRECFRPPPGWLVISADLSMAELHTVAQLCLDLFGASQLAQLLNAGVDVHWWLAAVTLAMEYEACIAGGHTKDRQRVKPGNFGFWGGMGAEKFILYSRKGYGIRFTMPEAIAFKAQWKQAFPETTPYFEWIARMLGDRSSFTHVHPRTRFVRGGCYYTSGANHGFQHLCAYGAKLGLYQVTKRCYTPGSDLFGCRPWNFVHDEIVCIAPAEQAPAAAVELARVFSETFNQFVPDVPCRSEPVVSTVWSKHAKSKMVDGKLSVWTPPEVPCSY